MKKFISILSIIALLAISLFSFTGCGSDTENKEENNGANDVADVTEDVNFINNNDSYFFTFEGKTFKAGDKISDLSSVNLSVRDRELEEEVPANKYMIGAGYVVNADKKTILHVTPYNTEDSAVKVPETSIGGFNVDANDIEDDSRLADVEVYGGIKLGSTEEELKEVFGEPTSVYEGEYWDSYSYDSDEVYRSYEFRLDKDEGKVIYIEWQNLVFND